MADSGTKGLYIRSVTRKVGRMLLVGFAIILACIMILFTALFVWSSGKPRPISDENGKPLAGSISEKVFVNINGVKQGMFIQSKDAGKPVLLFLHGGPGMPEYWLTQQYPTGLEDYFTICWWDQRGAGLSYQADIAPETMTVDQMVADTLEVTQYLRQRFGKDKIYLMGHSGGSFFGLLAARQAPELYHAYIGIGQITFQLESEKLAYDYMLQEYKKSGNEKMLKRLEAVPPPTTTAPLSAGYKALRDEAMHGIGIGTTRSMKSVITGIFFPSFLTREFTLTEKINLWRGKIFSSDLLRDPMFATDLTRQVTALQIPVYFFHGRYDYTCSYTLAKAYYEELEAPVKGFYTFEQSAHTPIFEEPQKAREIIEKDVLTGTNGLADVK